MSRVAFAAAIAAVGCQGDSDASTSDAGSGSDGTTADSSGSVTSSSPTTTTSGTTDGGSSGSTTTAGTGTGTPSDCDYQAVDGLVTFEAESLPINEDWSIESAQAGFLGTGYISWSGPAFNGDPTHGVMTVAIGISEPGRYRLQWRNRIGMGNDTTEHNDAWVRFPDPTTYYGLQGGAMERRVYPRPTCEDASAMAAIEALPEVESAGCVEGSSVDDWFKVYSSDATDWRWSTFTNDNNGHDVMVEFDAPGTYDFSVAARADFLWLDRIALHREDLDDALVQDPANAETVCP